MKYFDYAATTPINSDALQMYAELSKLCFGNTSSLHDIGSEAAHFLKSFRKELAMQLGVESEGIYFTSGGTEGNLLALIALARTYAKKGLHIITSMGEHASVDSALLFLQKEGFEVTAIPFTKDGFVDLDLLEKAIRKDTILVSIQHVNPEIGTIQPLADIAKIVQKHQILFHSDCVQSFGKICLKTISSFVDCLTISSHKVYGPKGVGAIYLRPSKWVQPVFPGFHHEKGFRGGTINVPAIGAFVTAAKKQLQKQSSQQLYYEKCRALFLENLFETFVPSTSSKCNSSDHIIMNTIHFSCPTKNHVQLKRERLTCQRPVFSLYQAKDESKQVPQIIGLGLKGVEGQLTMLECNRYGFAISTGSACQVGQQNASKAMQALKVKKNQAKEFIRISFGMDTSIEDTIQLGTLLKEIQASNKYNEDGIRIPPNE
ncbi:IscS subfamily cysteine desulfurase [Bacillus chungangensis]|uniref:Cysteine desulfurase n=1 Tax=Bacillus chungangensis TaxID=587633 RepID=A0ABT9WMG4_9BACI|nr:IscS subfamily cysteine desulfurase [Bacillus chungangensis]MDQ0174304.1 cysteine desulfurase [Bacillus chungangensis]